VSGSVTGVVEEEQLTPGTQAGYPVSAQGNEDNNDLNNLDTDETATQVTNVKTGTFTGPFGVTITGSEGTPSFSFSPVTDGMIVTKIGGANLTSGGAGAPVRYSLIDATHLIGYVDVGTQGNGYAAGDRVVFAIQITDQMTGAYAFTLLDHLDHPAAASGSANEETILIDLGGRVTVSDNGQPGDSAAIANFSMTVIDDTPIAFAPEHIYVEDVAHTVLSGQINFASNAGADGLGDVTFNVAEAGAVTDASGGSIFLNGEQVFFHIVNSHTVEGRSSAANGSHLAFTAALHPGTDTWDFTLNGTLFNGNQFTTFGATPSGGNNAVVGFNVLSSPDTPSDLLVTANGSNTVNTNTGSFGVGSGQSVGNGETIRFDFVTNEATGGALATTTYGTHYEVASFSETVEKTNGTTSFTIRGVNADNDTVFFGDLTGETTASGLTVVVTNGSGNSAPTVTNNADGTVTLSGIDEGDSFVVLSNSDPFSAIEITGASSKTFKLGPATFTTANAVDPFDISIPVVGKDGDNDPQSGVLLASLSPDPSTTQGTSNPDNLTTTATIKTLLGEDGNDILTGLGTQSDVLAGGRGSDTLSGLGGNDSLSGGSGNDTFKWGTEAIGVGNVDKILDYNFLDGDKLNFNALVGSLSAAGVAAYVKIVGNGADLQFQVDPTGMSNFATGTAYTLVGLASVDSSIRFSIGGQSFTIQNPVLHSLALFTTAADPIFLDLDHNGYSFSTLEHGVQFDINADGGKDQVAWNTSNDGILALDVNGDGKIDNGSEIFTPDFKDGHFASGSAALASLDTNHDGLVDANDVDFSKLLVWNDANANGVDDEGEVTSLASHGATSLTAPGTPADEQIDGQSVTAHGVVTFADGTTGDYIEAVLDASLGTPAPLLGADDSSSLAEGLDWDNIVIGRPDQADTLHGTDGADKFTLTDIHAVDLIADYNFEQGDSVDISALLGDHSGAAKDNAADYVRYEGNALQVDVDGAAGGHDFVDVSILNQPVADVKIVLDDGVDVTINHVG
jgi:hypothetical protein